MEKNWVLVEYDQYNDCGVNGFAGVTGPYTEEEAVALEKKMNDRKLYAVSFEARELSLRVPYDQ